MIAAQHNTRIRSGFTLVELSIVLVILGLLTGGILAGQSLIRAAEMRAVNTEFSRYVTAMQTFRDKYFALPGDMVNATKFWGDNNAICPDPLVADGTPGTCNGNGNGQVSNWSNEDAASEPEMWRAWQQLANAGLVEGSYSGVNGGANYRAAIGTNIPRSKLSNAGWTFVWLGNYSDSQYFNANYGNYFAYGNVGTKISGGIGVLKGEEAWNIDTKSDDGLPHRGRVLAFTTAWNADCVAASNTDYNLTSSNRAACGLNFLPGL